MSEQRFSLSSSSPSLTRALAQAFEHAIPGSGVYYRHNQSSGRLGQTGLGGAGGSTFDDPSEDTAVEEIVDRFTVDAGATVRYPLSDDSPCHVWGNIAVAQVAAGDSFADAKVKAQFFNILSDGVTPRGSFSGAGVTLPGGSDQTGLPLLVEIHSGELKLKLLNSSPDGTATVDISFKVKTW